MMKLTPFDAQLLCSIMLSVRNSCRLELEGRLPNTPTPEQRRAEYLSHCIALTEKVLQAYQQAQGETLKVDPKLVV